MIVIIGTDNHYQVESIKNKLIDKQYNVVLVDFAQNSNVLISAENGAIEIECEGVSLKNSKLVYNDPKYLEPQFGDSEEWASKYINARGWKFFNRNLFEILDGVKLNSLSTIWISSLKINQLKLALQEGFKIPPSVLSNNKDNLVAIHDRYESIIAKDICDGEIPIIGESVSQKVIMTSPVSKEMICSSDEKQPFPVLMQKNIEKRFEYRIVVAGESMISFRIDSNQHPIMKQDYRRGGFMVNYEKVQLDACFEKKLLNLHNKFNLFSGSYDFIEGTDGEFYFLEVNPAGVWAYIDKTCNGQISDLFANEISKIYEKLQ